MSFLSVMLQIVISFTILYALCSAVFLAWRGFCAMVGRMLETLAEMLTTPEIEPCEHPDGVYLRSPSLENFGLDYLQCGVCDEQVVELKR